jgi:hypothetical protein
MAQALKLKTSSSLSLSDYINKMSDIISIMSDRGVETTGPFKTSLLLSGLQGKHENLKYALDGKEYAYVMRTLKDRAAAESPKEVEHVSTFRIKTGKSKHQICWMCEQEGHPVFRCPQAMCVKCGKKGHLASACKVNKTESVYVPWILDSGATRHMTGQKMNLNWRRELPSLIPVVTADGTKLYAEVEGYTTVEDKLLLKKVLVVDGLQENLISANQLITDGANIVLDKNECTIKHENCEVKLQRDKVGFFVGNSELNPVKTNVKAWQIHQIIHNRSLYLDQKTTWLTLRNGIDD